MLLGVTRGATAAAVAIMTAVALAGACAVYDERLLGGSPSCDRAVPVQRPSVDAGNSGAGPYVLALATIDLEGDAGGGELVGFDLDGVCSCPAGGSCVNGSSLCDDRRGRDNAAGGLFADLQKLAGGKLVFLKVNERIKAGTSTAIIRIKRLDDLVDDADVEVSLYASNGKRVSSDGGVPQPADFDGGGAWTIDPDSLKNRDGAPPLNGNPWNTDVAAFVSGGVLVAKVERFSLRLAGDTDDSALRVDLSDVYLSARIVPRADGTFTLEDGVVGARWPTRDFLSALQEVRFNDSYLCGSSGAYSVVRERVCAARDLAASPQYDRAGVACGALSLAFRFTATPAKFGGVYAGKSRIYPCGATYSDECP